MPYKPTGRPPGRPPVKPKPQPKPAEIPTAKPEVKPEAVTVQPEPVRDVIPRPGPFQICHVCYPDGWPKGATGLACQHGIWSRPWSI